MGVKIRKTVKEADTQATTHYMGTFQYNNNTLQYIHTSEGYVRHTPPSNSVDGTLGAFDYVYNYTDHLGNVRLSYTLDPSDQQIKILEENHYYPFGMKHTYNTSRKDIRFDEAFLNPNLTPSENGNRRVEMVSNSGYQYKYNGKEFQDELGLAMYDYGARNYNPAIGRWMNIDPLAETSRRFNPYTYCLNNPVYFIDPDGMEATSSDVLTEADFDVTVDIGYGRKMSASKISGAINYSGAKIGLSESGEEKFKHAAELDARNILEQNGYKPDESLTFEGGELGSAEEKKGKADYAKGMVNKIPLLRNLYKLGNSPSIEFVGNIRGAEAQHVTTGSSNIVKLTYASFRSNFNLFNNLIHEGVHAFDFSNNPGFYNYNSRGNLLYSSVSILESRAWRTNLIFGYHDRNHAENKYSTYANDAKGYGYDVTSWDIYKFFNALMK